MLRVERWRLEAVGAEDDLSAPTRLRFTLGRPKQSGSETGAAFALAHPQELHLGAAAPGVAAEPGADRATGVAHEDREVAAIAIAGRREVVLVDLFFEEREVDRSRVLGHLQDFVRHRCIMPCSAAVREGFVVLQLGPLQHAIEEFKRERWLRWPEAR